MKSGYDDYTRCLSSESPEVGIRKNQAWTSWRSERRNVICAGIVSAVFFPMVLLSLAQIVHGFLGLSTLVWAGDVQNYLKPIDGGNQQWYPTSFTRDIVPKPIHSHNDYWRKVPLYEAISLGCISVEADIWHIGSEEELYVGHSLSSLTRNRTLNSLYIDPLLSILTQQNPETDFAHNTQNGIFDTDAGQTLYLYIDIKTDSNPTYNSLLTHLTPLIPHLSYYNSTSSTFHFGAITIIVTGNAPFDLIASSANSIRYAFYDAPVDELLSSPNDNKYNSTNSLMSSGAFSELIGTVIADVTEVQRNKIQKLVEAAHNKGIGIRFWDTPGWPVGRRNKVWRTLVEEGVDLLNADDLSGASGMDW